MSVKGVEMPEMTWDLDVENKWRRRKALSRIHRFWECRLRVWWLSDAGVRETDPPRPRRRPTWMTAVFHVICAVLLTLMIMAIGALIAYLRYYHQDSWRDMLHDLFCGCHYPEKCRRHHERQRRRRRAMDVPDPELGDPARRPLNGAMYYGSGCHFDTVEMVDETRPAPPALSSPETGDDSNDDAVAGGGADGVTSPATRTTSPNALLPEWMDAVHVAVQAAVQATVQVSGPRENAVSPAT